MRLFCLLLISFFIQLVSFSQDYKNVFLLDQWKTDTLATPPYGMVFNETWGFVHEGREYGVIGSTEGTHIFELQKNNRFRPVDFVKGNFSSPQVVHRDYHDYDGYLYAVCDEGNSSLQIMDLQYLPDSVHVVVNDSVNFGRVHNIFIDSSSALLYACTFTPIVGNPSLSFTSLKVFSLTDPLNPVEVFGGFEHITGVHDAYVVNDTAFLNCGYDGLWIYNFATPENPVLIGSLTVYQDQGFNHSGWLSPDRRFYYFVDESTGKRIKKVNVTDLANPMITSTFGTNNINGSIAHNIMVTNNLAFVSYYNEGLRIFDTRFQPPREVAHYDTYPVNDSYKMNGAWGVYSLLPSGRILISDRTNGLFLFDFDQHIFEIPHSDEIFTVFPNPSQSGQEVVFRFNERDIRKIKFYIYDNMGRIVFSKVTEHQDYWTLNLVLASGSYNYSVYYENFMNEESLKQGHVIVLD